MRREPIRSRDAGTAAILASAVAYGFLAVMIKLALEAGAQPVPLVAWRFALAAPVVWLFLHVRRRPAPPQGALLPLAGLGFLYAVNSVAFTLALERIPASTATLVFYTYPVVVVLMAAAFLGERLTRRRATSVAVAVVGCALTAGVGALRGDPGGIGLVLVATGALSLYIVAGRPLLARLPGHGSAAVIVTVTAAAVTIAALATEGLSLGGGARARWLVALLALVGTAIPITLFVIGLKRVDAGRAAILSTLEPVVTVTAASLVLGERIATLQYLGGALILAGVLGARLERPLPSSEEPTPLEAP
jgi:drug/metabolite transporter (DMT)-like permease